MSEFKKDIVNCARLCKKSYLYSTEENKDTDTQFLIEDNVIAWRGTENINDWLTNLDFDFVESDFGFLHHGFYNAYLSLVDKIPKDKKYIITGHSLGGALALVNSIDFLSKGIKIKKLITFGQPRVFDTISANNLKEKYKFEYLRLVHNNDIVPRVPFNSMDFGHFGTFLYFNHRHMLDTNMTWKQIKKDRIVGRVIEVYKTLLERQTDGVRDHSIYDYYECALNI